MVSFERCVVPRIDRVLPGREVSGLVAGELQSAPGQVDELVMVHQMSPAVECGPRAGSCCIFLSLTSLS